MGPAIRIALAACLCAPAAARAESSLALDAVALDRRAKVYDESGEAVGRGRAVTRARPGGGLELVQRVSVAGRLRSESVLVAAIAGDGTLRPESQSALSLDAEGERLAEMRVDHRRGIARCRQAERAWREIALPPRDRIANAALPWLLPGLARGDAEAVEVEFLLCRGRPRLFGLRLRRRPLSEAAVEIRGEYALPGPLSWVPRRLRPRPVWWYGPGGPDPWLGEELSWDRGLRLLREGFDPGAFAAAGPAGRSFPAGRPRGEAGARSERRGSNPRPRAWEARALPTELLSRVPER